VQHSVNYHQFLVSPEIGGASQIGLHLARWASHAGARAHVWLPARGRAATAFEQAGVRWQTYGLGAMQQGSTRHALACLGLALRLRRRGGLAHIHTPMAFRLIRPALRLSRLRTVVHVHTEESAAELRWAFRDLPDLILPCARFLAGVIRRGLGELGERVRIAAVPNAVDSDVFFPGDRPAAKHKVGAPLDRPMMLMLANLAPNKGQETAIRAAAELRRRGTNLACWLAGVEREGAGYLERLKQLTVELGVVDQVRFLGFRNDGPDLLRAADFLLLPSTIEGLPLSILEAQASKVTVLASAVGGVPEVVTDGETGFLIPETNALAYAERIALLLDNPDTCRRITDRAYANVKQEHSWPTYCRRVGELYEELMEIQPADKHRESAPDSTQVCSGSR
jgi:glycosyltransferase involved in cell wall biosynthesis